MKREFSFVIALFILLFASGCYEYINPLDPKGGDNLVDLDTVSVTIDDDIYRIHCRLPDDVSTDDMVVIFAATIDSFDYSTNTSPTRFLEDGNNTLQWDIEYTDIASWDNFYFRIGHPTTAAEEGYTWWSRIIHYPLINQALPMNEGVDLSSRTYFDWPDAEHAAEDYEIKYSLNTSGWDTVEVHRALGDSSYTDWEAAELQEGDIVYWQIRVYDTDQSEFQMHNLWSSKAKFTYKSTLEVGDLYAGGRVFYLNSGSGMCSAPRQDAISWGAAGDEINGDDAGAAPELTAIGTGASNTEEIVNFYTEEGGNDILSYAAGVCSNLDYNGYDDWFLPSQNEMIEMESTRDSNNLGIGTDILWTSTEIDADYARSIVTWGADSDTSKNSSCDYFPVRSFTY